MVPQSRFLYFVLFLVGITLFLAGGLGWFITADQDYSITFQQVTDEAPPGVANAQLNVETYDDLNEQQRADFQRAVEERTVVHYDTHENVWADVITKDDRYYKFKNGGHVDWLDPMTFGTAIASLLGLGLVVQTARWEIRMY
ncbi:hypothetical protein ACFPYI_18180 [Halomarina salina]|uniref:DUF3592 domain-containing protein n=1 Tax=Halomarina salina TaxID=1872699 RepID=A0ABD5RS48_9EURY|nr:hypothetical protein [Halomarina salina]